MAGKTPWTAHELQYLEKHYSENNMADLVANIGRSAHAIRWKASQLGWLLRDGRNFGPIQKITVSVTKQHYSFLKAHKHNQSNIIRQALDLYIKKHAAK